MQDTFMFTSESVTEGHPDKLCDRISDAIVGSFLRRDRSARVVAECAVSTGIVFLSVKYRSSAHVDVAEIARGVIAGAGYRDGTFDAKRCTVMTSLNEMPPDGVHVDERTLSDGELDRVLAQDQATLFGFACLHTQSMIPLPIWLAHRLARRLADARSSGELPYLAPDGKTQVGVEFRDRRPQRIHGLTLICSQHADAPATARIREDLLEHVIAASFDGEELRPDQDTRIAINPEGPIVEGGPAFHAGLTGRKTAVDTYGEFARHSGAALSGKDPSRIDRIGAYAARHAAKNVVAAGLASECEVQLSYSIGEPHPVSVHVETFGTNAIADREIEHRVRRRFDFRVAAIEKRFGLRELPARHPDGFFAKLAAYGHMGRVDIELPWERLDEVDALR